MLGIIIAIILTSAFFILFFRPQFDLKNKKETESASTTDGFIQDTREVFVAGWYPYDVMDSKARYGDIGNFTGYSTVSEQSWLYGFPHKNELSLSYESPEDKLYRRMQELRNN